MLRMKVEPPGRMDRSSEYCLRRLEMDLIKAVRILRGAQ